MYSPTLGRFLQTDPVGYADDLNWYAYVGNDPINLSDPTGLACTASQFAQATSDAIAKWWDASVAGFKSESPVQTAPRVLDGFPVEATAVGAIGAIKGGWDGGHRSPGGFWSAVQDYQRSDSSGGSAWI
jgi:uncharacterized protein RhaS with RHS repeats